MSTEELSDGQWLAFFVSFGALFGLLIGSFLNVVIWRVPNKISLSSPGSHCPHCKEPIRPIDNIPVLSYLFLRGKCRNCSTKISLRYPLVELFTAFVWAFTVYKVGLEIHTIGYLLFFSGLIALSAIDIDTKLLPKKVVYVSGILLVLFLVASAIAGGELFRIKDCLIVAGAYSAFLFIIWFATGGKAMGFGDVRLAMFLGFAMGYYGFIVSYFGMLASFAIGSFAGISIAVITHKGRKMKIPFGPFLAAGTVIVIWYAPEVRGLVQF